MSSSAPELLVGQQTEQTKAPLGSDLDLPNQNQNQVESTMVNHSVINLGNDIVNSSGSSGTTSTPRIQNNSSKRQASNHAVLFSDPLVGNCKIPPENPRKSNPRRKVVFVNPEEQNVYWWPAMIVPQDEYHLFSQSIEEPDNNNNDDSLGNTKDTNIKSEKPLKFELPKPGEVLVTYFEDGSYNTVKEKDLLQFCPYNTPYVEYAKGNLKKQFCRDKAVQLATLYWETGRIPSSFTWLHGLPREDRSHASRINPVSSNSNSNSVNGGSNSSKRSKSGNTTNNTNGIYSNSISNRKKSTDSTNASNLSQSNKKRSTPAGNSGTKRGHNGASSKNGSISSNINFDELIVGDSNISRTASLLNLVQKEGVLPPVIICSRCGSRPTHQIQTESNDHLSKKNNSSYTILGSLTQASLGDGIAYDDGNGISSTISSLDNRDSNNEDFDKELSFIWRSLCADCNKLFNEFILPGSLNPSVAEFNKQNVPLNEMNLLRTTPGYRYARTFWNNGPLRCLNPPILYKKRRLSSSPLFSKSITESLIDSYNSLIPIYNQDISSSSPTILQPQSVNVNTKEGETINQNINDKINLNIVSKTVDNINQDGKELDKPSNNETLKEEADDKE